MLNDLDFKDSIILDISTKKMPKTAKQNLTPSGKRKPLTRNMAILMYDKPLTLKRFQRIASRYYLTTASVFANGLTLKNQITLQLCEISFTTKYKDYILVKKIRRTPKDSILFVEFYIKRPKTTKELFIKLLDYNLI